MYSEEFVHFIAMIQMLKIVYDKTGEVIYPGEILCNDLEYEIYYQALRRCTTYANDYYYQNDEATKWVFCDDKMTEFYRLCKEYGRRNHVSLKENPFVQKANKEVRVYMENICDYSYDWWIQIGTHHQYASSLYFYTGPEFYQTCLAVEAIYKVFDFYSEALEEIRKELKPCTALTVYRTPINILEERKAA